MKRLFSNWVIIPLCCMCGCTSNGQDLRQAKNDCYTNTLNELRNEPAYNEVMSQFVDTFKIMKNEKQYFGAPPGFYNKIDEAIFFNNNKSE